MSKKNFLVIGGNGQLGRALTSQLKKMGHSVISTVHEGKPEGKDQVFLNLSEDISNWKLPKSIDAAFLCAAITSLTKCYLYPLESRKVNVENTFELAHRLSKENIAIFFPSTNLVFSGQTPEQKATDPVNPLCEYGRQKAKIESMLIELTEKVVIARFTKIISPDMPIIKQWFSDLQNERTIYPFSDMVLSPISLDFAIEVILAIMECKKYGLWQISAKEDITYEEMANYFAKKIGASKKLIQPIRTNQSNLVFETVPKFTTLDISKLKNELYLEPPRVWDILDKIFFETINRI